MYKLNIEKLIGWAPDLSIERGASIPKDFEILSGQISFKNISANQARRLSSLTKVSAELALEVLHEKSVDHIVFSSRHGELINSTQLLEMIANNEVLSPTLFSQSVHNTAVGALSILKQTNVPTTSLGGGRNGFLYGLISSYLSLQENPTRKVLYLCADEKIPEIFSARLEEENIPFAVAMILSLDFDQNGIGLEISNSTAVDASKDPVPQALRFLKWLFQQNDSLHLANGPTDWILSKA